MLRNIAIIAWAETALIRAGAAYRCPTHGLAISALDDDAVHRTVDICRRNPFEDLSANAAELAVLETYLSLPEECVECGGAHLRRN